MKPDKSRAEFDLKIRNIDAEDNVTTLIECTPENPTDGYVTKTVSMSPGENRIKIVGFDCRNIDLKMFFEISQPE